MPFLAALDAADATLGGKARSLARLAAADLATPPGFVITDALFRVICPRVVAPTIFDDNALASLDELRRAIQRAPWPDGFQEQLASQLRGLGGDRFSVRSSFANEDLEGALAAGVYASSVDVAPHHVEDALRDVLCSAVSPGAAAYAMAHGCKPAAPPVAVLVHSYVRGEAEGSAAFAPGTTPEPVLMLRRGSLPAEARAELQQTLERLAHALGPVEIEWVLSARGLVYLQLRPFQPKATPAPWQGWTDLDGDPAAWRWDVAHNPLPLSPAQVGLVEFVDEHCRIGIRQRVLGGYLFYSVAPPGHGEEPSGIKPGCPSPASPSSATSPRFAGRGGDASVAPPGEGEGPSGTPRFAGRGGDASVAPPGEGEEPSGIDPAGAADYFEALRGYFDAELAQVGAEPSLEEALALFALVYQRIFGVLQPALKRTRRELQGFLRDHAPAQLSLLPALGAGVPSMAEERRRLATAIRRAGTDADRAQARADYLARFGDEAPIWDVSVPTYAEDPSPLLLEHGPALPQASAVDWRAANAQVELHLADPERQAWRRLLALAREAVALSEADDWLYARAQAVVRRALLSTGRQLARAGRLTAAAEVFLLPLTLVQKRPGAAEVDLRAVASAGRAAVQSAYKNPPPTSFSRDDQAVRGHGTGGNAIGRIVVHRSGQFRTLPSDAVLLASTLLPTELPMVAAAAIVTETGGPLDHVAAQARERGIPAVIGAAGASSLLHEGDLVLVDGERGLVVKLAWSQELL